MRVSDSLEKEGAPLLVKPPQATNVRCTYPLANGSHKIGTRFIHSCFDYIDRQNFRSSNLETYCLVVLGAEVERAHPS